jgi:8-oxo-dGTP diphosphatase
MKNHRIAGGGIVIHNGKILLVRYKNNSSGSFLAAPGGGAENNENIKDTVVREILEETGILVEPISVIMIEDLDCSNFKMCKIWMNCRYVKGEIAQTQKAVTEGIYDVRWYTRDELKNETVYPSMIMNKSWELLSLINNDVYIPSTRTASF